MSRVARTIQSIDDEVRLRMNRSSPRWIADSCEPDQPSFGNGSSGRSVSRCSARS